MARAVAAELMQQLRLDLVFVQVGAGVAHGAAVGLRGDGCGAAHDVKFVSILDQAHLVQLGAHVADLVRCAYAAAYLGLYLAAQFE